MAKQILSLHTWGRDPLEVFEACLSAERNAWTIRRRQPGALVGDRRIDRVEATRRQKTALARLAAAVGD